MLVTIISGGQTGVDRAALDWAIANGIPHGGWCPKGRRAEDGVIPNRYDIQETPQRRYQQRTRWNVRDADATLLITLEPTLSGGTQFTRECAESMGKPWLHVFPGGAWPTTVRDFLASNHVQTLNVAGPRASAAPGIERFVHEVLNRVLSADNQRSMEEERSVPSL